MATLQQTGHRIIIGVDFGTTFTGVSWVSTATGSSVDDVMLINDWGGKTKTADYNWKAPTVVAYRDENTAISMQEDKWGFGVEPNMVAWSWMKLLLDKDQAKTHYDDAFQEVKEHPNKEPEEMICDYLRCVYRFLIWKLGHRTGNLSQALPFEFWFTTPAIWSDKAKDATKRAALKAGFGSRPGDQIFLIQEPEAAAVAVLKELTSKGEAVIVRRGDGVLICDCGGGTVDIVTYKVTQTEPTLEFEELVIGSGGKCGSTCIDRRFLAWMSQTFGSAFDNTNDKLKGPGSRLMKEFESAKREFRAEGEDSYEVTLHMRGVRDSELYEEDESKVKISWSTMKSFFQPAVDDIIGLVQEQIQQAERAGGTINKVVLVGGFGDSQYLYTELKDACRTSSPQVDVLCPKHPQAAVVKGAALRGLENLTPQRKRCRRHYGFEISLPFREGIDPPEDAWSCPFSNLKLCSKRITWAMSKGDFMDEKTLFSFDVENWRTEENLRESTQVRLVGSTFEDQPERISNPGVDVVGEIACHFNNLDSSKLEKKRTFWTMTTHYRVRFKIQVLPSRKDGVLCFKVVSQGQEVGSAQIKYAKS